MLTLAHKVSSNQTWPVPIFPEEKELLDNLEEEEEEDTIYAPKSLEEALIKARYVPGNIYMI